MSKSRQIKITFLGTGTSQGVPVIGCKCAVCTSKDFMDSRLRTSISISSKDTTVVIDTGPDFRQQMLNNDINKLDAILYTHEHKDHIAGLDDIRAYNYQQKKAMQIFCTESVLEALTREYHYVFDSNFHYPGIPEVTHTLITKNDSLTIEDLDFTCIEVMHYKMPVLGFRVGNFTYITDANFISNQEKQKIIGSEILVVNALRKEKHISHFNLEEALKFIEEINPKQAYLTHISHLMGPHSEVSEILPPNVSIAYDGLTIEHSYES